VNKIALVVLALGLSGCADAWMTGSQKDATQATQAVVNERVAKGEMTSAEGKMVMANQRAGMEDQARMRMATAYAGVGTYQQVGPGTVVKY